MSGNWEGYEPYRPPYRGPLAQLFQVTVKTFDLGKEFHIERVLIQYADGILGVNSGKQLVACISNGAQMAGRNIAADADHSKIFRHGFPFNLRKNYFLSLM